MWRTRDSVGVGSPVRDFRQLVGKFRGALRSSRLKMPETCILAQSGVRLLDIGQAVIHDALALGMLVELTGGMKTWSMLTELLLKAHQLGVPP